MNKHINSMNNVTAANFDLEALSDILKTLRASHKSVLAIDEDRAEAQAKLKEAQAELQKAVDSVPMDYDNMGKYNAVCKRLEAKLAENPIERIQAFDAAVNKLHDFTQQKVVLEAVETKKDAA